MGTKNKKEYIGLSTTKDVQDAVLKDPKYAAIVNVIDIKYWHYQADGSAYAPEGGRNLAPRQWARLLKPKASSFEQVYRAVQEYRLRYPGKAVMYSADGADKLGWAVFMAGGSLALLPEGTDKNFLTAATEMTPVAANERGHYVLQGNKGMIVYNNTPGKSLVSAPLLQGKVKVHYISAKTGKLLKTEPVTVENNRLSLTFPDDSGIAWISQ